MLPSSAIPITLGPLELQVNMCAWRKFRTNVDCLRRTGDR